MSPFWSGFLGAIAALFVLGALRRLVFRAAFRRFARRGGLHGPRARMVWLFRRLGAKPEQEQILKAELDALFFDAQELRGEAAGVRAALAKLLAEPALEEAAVSAALEGPLAKLSTLRTRLAGSIARVHASLDPEQRTELAAMVAEGPWRRGHGRCGHRRGMHGGHGGGHGHAMA